MERKRKRHEPPAATAASAVASVFGSRDLFHEIILCLDVLADLVCAALVCKHWFRLVSDAVFLCRYRRRHPLRPLGFFAVSSAHLSMRFVPMRRPSALARIHNGFKASVGKDTTLSVSGCRNGRLIVATKRGRDGVRKFAVFSPLYHARGTPALKPLPPAALIEREHCFRHVLLPEHGGDGMSCTAVTVMFDDLHYSRVLVHVSELQAGAWGEERVSNILELPQLWGWISQPQFLLASGKIYILGMARHVLCLSLRYMSLYRIRLPDQVCYLYPTNLMMSRPDAGSGIYLVQLIGFQLRVWLHSFKWEQVDTICLRQAFADSSWNLKTGADVVYLAAVGDNAEFVFLWVRRALFCIRIATRAVEKVYEYEQYQQLETIHPLMTIWPVFPSLKD